jgi:hypothetical protein
MANGGDDHIATAIDFVTYHFVIGFNTSYLWFVLRTSSYSSFWRYEDILVNLTSKRPDSKFYNVV